MAPKAKSTAMKGLEQVQSSIRDLQREGEKFLGRMRKEAVNLVPKEQRKRLEDLVAQATRIRNDVQKRAEKALKDLESRAEKLFRQLEARAEKRIEPLVRRLNVPSRSEIDSLARRVSSLERRLDEISTKAA
ncbi:MAG: phasin family protein [Candidatus Binatia bacterium]